jgi:hypothetical protein
MRWWAQPEALVLKKWLQLELQEVKDRPMKYDYDFSNPQRVYQAARCQGEVHRIEMLLDEKLIDRLNKLTGAE